MTRSKVLQMQPRGEGTLTHNARVQRGSRHAPDEADRQKAETKRTNLMATLNHGAACVVRAAVQASTLTGSEKVSPEANGAQQLHARQQT
jgi:hypothetical protein